MKKLLLVLMVFPVLAFAEAPQFPSLEEVMQRSSVDPKLGCVNFTGFWKGQCYDQNKQPGWTPNVSFMQFDCNTLVEGVNGYDIGYTRLVTREKGDRSYKQYVTYSWPAGEKSYLNHEFKIVRENKADNTKIVGHSTGFMARIQDVTYVRLQGVFKLYKDGQLVSEEPENVDCIYELQ